MKRIFKPLLWLIYLLILAGGGYYAFQAAYTFAMDSPFAPGLDFVYATPTPTLRPGEPTPTLKPGETPAAEIPVNNLGYDAWNGAERVTILVMGLDYRDWEIGEGAPRTDTMMLLTIDPLSKTAGMLSIPRDLFVSIPGFNYERINVAYRQGEIYEYRDPTGGPEGGPGLAVATVEQLLGVEINFYALVDFYAFEKVVDEIGGVELTVTEPILVDPVGDKIPRVIEPGRYNFPGDMLLAYARARKTEGGDFDRARRQQDVIIGIRNRLLEDIPGVVSKAPILYSELAEGVKTNMTLTEAIQLGLLAKDISLESIRKGAISEEHIVFFTTPTGDQVLKPRPDAIRELRDYIFGTVELSSPLASMTQDERVAAENASISVLNGSFTEGLAATTAEYLRGLGFNIPAENIGNAGQALTFTTLVDYTGNPYTVQRLAELLGVQRNRVILEYNPNRSVDVEVSLGSDWQVP
jgi:LCP family protein required for cell wall assembly